jgi:hypothetical protein
LKVIVLELNPKDDWTGEYNMLTTIWSKWFTEMGIKSYAFIKDDNINEINESIEKLLKVKLPSSANISSISWYPVTDTDPEIAKAAKNRPAYAATEPVEEEPVAAEAAPSKASYSTYTSYSDNAATAKKKDKEITRVAPTAPARARDTSNILTNTNSKKPISKPNKEQEISFGPAY